jgi:hypothetical protein
VVYRNGSAKALNSLSDWKLLCFIDRVSRYMHVMKPSRCTICLRFIKSLQQLGRPRRRWEDNIKMDLQEVGGGGGDWKVAGSGYGQEA